MASPTRVRFPQPPLPGASAQRMYQWQAELVRVLEIMEQTRTTPASKSNYVTQNFTTDRDLDPSSDTTEQIGDVVATLIEDLKAKGVLR